VGTPLDLFAAASTEGAWTVGEVTRRARAVIEAGLPPLWVRGEVSGFKAWRSGHWYFSLRDKTAQIRCVMFHNDNRGLPAAPVDGTQVFAFVRPTIYDQKGDFQLTVHELLSTEQGGLWKLALEKAKAALRKDGLLDPARKRRLPRFPRRIGVVTSADGAALHDIEVVMARRWPIAELVLVAAKVQGEGAEASLCAALARLSHLDIDVAIVGRGGGAAEDLWTFNSERVARAVAALPMPVISAVGHETDVTLCDLVADLRAPTPSAAAEAATPDRAEVLVHVAHLAERLARGLAQRSQRMVDRMDRTGDRLTGAIAAQLAHSGSLLRAHGARLDGLSPLKILARGYAVATDSGGRVLKRVAQLPVGQAFRLRVTDGEVGARVSSPPDPLSVPERGNDSGVSSPLSRRERGPGGEDGRGAEP
jgi:exodeoxyribonuclease VII large subunit